MTTIAKKFLKISELAEAVGLPISTIRHYINEGLLGQPAKTSKNMAYYDKDTIPKISLIKRLQNELFLPLKVIKKLFSSYEALSLDDYELIVDVKKRLAEESDLLPSISNIPHDEIIKHTALTEEELTAIEKKGAITPEVKYGCKYYNETDYRLIKALSDFRSLGYTAELGVTVAEFDIYIRTIRELAKSEARLFVERIAPNKSAKEIAEMVKKGVPTLNEVISALHQKLVMEELKRLEKTAKPKAP